MNLIRHAIRVWPRHELATKQQVNHLRREYIRKVQMLGDRYLLARANFVERRAA